MSNLIKQIFLFFVTTCIVFSVFANTKETNISKSDITIDGVTYTLQQALEFFLVSSLDVQKSMFDFLEGDTPLKQFQKKYSWSTFLSLGLKSSRIPSANESTKLLLGDERFNWDISAGLSKLFSTGTTILFRWDNNFERSNADTTSFGGGPTPDYYRPAFSFSLKQEVLKNWFGSNDRLQKKNYVIQQEIVNESLKNQLAIFFVQALEIYWNITVSTKVVENARDETNTAKRLYKVIINNVKLGLSEKFDVYQYKSLLEDSHNRLLLAQNHQRQLVRELLRLLNLENNVKITGITNLDNILPDLDFNSSLEEAFEKRSDYLNLQKELLVANNELKIKKNELLPSVQIEASASLTAQNININAAYKDIIPGFGYPKFSIYGIISYPFGDTSLKTNLRNAYFKVKKTELSIENLKGVIYNEVANSIDLVKINYQILNTTRKSRKDLEKYSREFINRANQGKYQYLQIKNIFDSVNNIRKRELEALVEFNLSLLRYYLAKNVLLEEYGVNFVDLKNKLLAANKKE